MGQITHYTQTHVFTSSSCGSRRHYSAVDENEVAWQCVTSYCAALDWTLWNCGHVETDSAARGPTAAATLRTNNKQRG